MEKMICRQGMEFGDPDIAGGTDQAAFHAVCLIGAGRHLNAARKRGDAPDL